MAIHLVDSGATISLEFTVDYNAGRGVISAQKIFIPKDDFEVGKQGTYVIIKDKDKGSEWKILYSDVTTPSGADADAVAALVEAFMDTSVGIITLGAGTALAGKFGIDQVTANANEVVTKTGSIITTLTSGNVGGFTTLVQSTVVMSVAGAYVTGDYMGTTTTPQSVTAVRVSGGTGVLKSILISDKCTGGTLTGTAMELWILDRTYTAPTDNAAWNMSDSDMLFVQAVIPLTATNWYPSSVGAVYVDGTLSIPIKSNGTTMFYALVARSTTKTFTSSDLTITFGILQD